MEELISDRHHYTPLAAKYHWTPAKAKAQTAARTPRIVHPRNDRVLELIAFNDLVKDFTRKIITHE